MSRGNIGVFSSTNSLKSGTSFLVLAVICHVIGFSLAKWSTWTFNHKIYNGTQSSWHAGLWQHNGCIQFDKEGCTWFFRSGAWLIAVQAMETLGLIGFSISGITSLVLVCFKRRKIVKIFNLLLLVGSDVCIIIGLIIFGVKHEDDLIVVYAIADDIDVNGRAVLGISYYLCGLAASICSSVCVPSLVMDIRESVQQDLERQTIVNTTQMQPVDPMSVCEHAQDNFPLAYGPQDTKSV